MKKFAIDSKPSNDIKSYTKYIDKAFLVLIIITFIIFSFYHNVTNILFSKSKIDVFKEDLQQIVTYFWIVDQNFSHFLATLDSLVEDYVMGKDIITTRADDIEETRQYIYQNQDYLKSLGFDNYGVLIDLLSDARKYKEEVFALLGQDKAFNYLIILQNSNEKRPNGGFFGSFAFVQFHKARIQELKIIDAYYPDFISPSTYLTAPDRSRIFLPESKIGFIAANKFGFTDMDGRNIKHLYELMFRNYNNQRLNQVMTPDIYSVLLKQDIKGVIFIQTELLEFLLPGFQKQIRERQFANASIDLIRGQDQGNKKEIYINQVNDFFNNNKNLIIQNFINKFPNILEKNLIHIFLSNVSDNMHGLLQKRGLSNVYSPDFIYARDTNDSFNKVDNFVQKQILISDNNGSVVVDTNVDKVSIKDLEPGNYNMRISYSLYVPDHYFQFIQDMEKKYEIELTDREKTILATKSNTGIDLGQGLRLRTRSTVYFPPSASIGAIRSDNLRHEQFRSPFSQGVFYVMKIEENNSNKTISIDFNLK